MYYVTCPVCGANLDPGERCDCTKKSRPANSNSQDGTGNQKGFPKNLQLILSESNNGVKPKNPEFFTLGGCHV